MTDKLPPFRRAEFSLEGEKCCTFADAYAAVQPLQNRIAELEAKELALHKILAESVLQANTGWARYEMANRMSNSLQAQLASRQEPVGRIESVNGGPNNHGVVVWLAHQGAPIKPGDKLYTHPAPAQQPLSVEAVQKLATRVAIGGHIGPLTFTRAVEAEHGIREKP